MSEYQEEKLLLEPPRNWGSINVLKQAESHINEKLTGSNGMLILTRRVGESLIIGDDIVVHVLGVKGNQVRIGVEAPQDVSVHREEIYKRIQADKNGKDAES